MKCDVCGNNFKIMQQREEVKNGFTRFIVYSSCNGCGAGMVHYYPLKNEPHRLRMMNHPKVMRKIYSYIGVAEWLKAQGLNSCSY